jgi:phospholipid/cholesterol/gamma-HCH transport system substrate-binding protein
MASARTQFSVGIFVLVGLAVIAVAVSWLGLSSYLQTGRYYLAFFDESVQGLDVDSPVKYRGVSIGRVEDIEVAPDGRLIQVTLRIETDIKPGKDMVAQLKSVGITGIMFVELDHKKAGAPDQSPRLSFPTKYPVIATRPSEIQKLLTGVNDVIQQVRAMDLEGIGAQVRETLDRLQATVEKARVEEISQAFRSALGNIDRIAADPSWEEILEGVRDAARATEKTVIRLDGLVGANTENVTEAVASLREAAERVNALLGEAGDVPTAADVSARFGRTLDRAETLLVEGTGLVRRTDDAVGRLARNLAAALLETNRALDQLNRLLEIVADQPSQLLFGEPPPEGNWPP